MKQITKDKKQSKNVVKKKWQFEVELKWKWNWQRDIYRERNEEEEEENNFRPKPGEKYDMVRSHKEVEDK